MTSEPLSPPEWYTKLVEDAHREYHRRMEAEWKPVYEEAQRLAISIDDARWEAIYDAKRKLKDCGGANHD